MFIKLIVKFISGLTATIGTGLTEREMMVNTSQVSFIGMSPERPFDTKGDQGEYYVMIIGAGEYWLNQENYDSFVNSVTAKEETGRENRKQKS